MVFAQPSLQPERFVLELNGDPYFLATPDQAKKAGYSRAWEVKKVSDSEARSQPFSVKLGDFSGGWGHVWPKAPNTYHTAAGWDCSEPGMASTWARSGQTNAQTAGAGKKWFFIMKHPSASDTFYIYVCMGRYVHKHEVSPSTNFGATPVETHDLGVGNVIVGAPAVFNGRAYVPRGSDDSVFAPTLTTWEELTTVANGAGDTWTTGSANRQARAFHVWDGPLGPVLVLANANKIRTASSISTPLVDGDWSDTSDAGDSSYGITDMASYKPNLLVIGRQDGWGTFNEEMAFKFEKKIPPDAQNCFGMAEHDGYIYIPTRMGNYRWRPGAYERVGEQRSQPQFSIGQSRSNGFVSGGEILYEVAGAPTSGDSEWGLFSYREENGRLVSHMHQTIDLPSGATSDLFAQCGILVWAHPDDALVYVSIAHPSSTTQARVSTYRVLNKGAGPPWDYELTDSVAKTLRTPFYAFSSSAVQKTMRGIRFHLEASTTSDAAKMSVWFRFVPATYAASESWTQMLNSSGAAASFQTAGIVELFFPKTSAAVGQAVQFEFREAAPAGAEVAAGYVVRDLELLGSVDVESTDEIIAVLVLGTGQHSDGTQERRDARTQMTELEALSDPQTAAVSYRDPRTGSTGYVKILEGLTFKEVEFKPGQPSEWVAFVPMRKLEYA